MNDKKNKHGYFFCFMARPMRCCSFKIIFIKTFGTCSDNALEAIETIFNTVIRHGTLPKDKRCTPLYMR